MSKLNNFKNNLSRNLFLFLFFLSFIYLILYIPFIFTVYSYSWHELNFANELILRDNISKDLIESSDKNLISYFLHNNELNQFWSKNEKIHMKEVRSIYDVLFYLFIFNLFVFIFLFKKFKIEVLKNFSKINLLLLIPFIIIILPFFSYFWNKIFHPIFFDNNYWIYKSGDISYYLFPNQFFFNTIIFILVIFVILNLFVNYFLLKILRRYIKKKE